MLFKDVIESFLTRLRRKQPSPPPSKGEVQYPLGLTKDQVASLRLLSSTPQWRTFTEALQAVCENEIARLIKGLSQDEYQLKCGRIQALMDVLTLPETIDLKAKELDDHARQSDAPPSGKRDLTFFGSPFWSPSRAPTVFGPVERP